MEFVVDDELPFRIELRENALQFENVILSYCANDESCFGIWEKSSEKK